MTIAPPTTTPAAQASLTALRAQALVLSGLTMDTNARAEEVVAVIETIIKQRTSAGVSNDYADLYGCDCIWVTVRMGWALDAVRAIPQALWAV